MSSSIWVFPGQGSQHKGMGEALFARFPDLVNEADEVLGYSIRELCLEDLNGVLGETEFTQPALFVVSALCLLAQREDGLAAPQCYAGHSLGEFAALFAAGAFDFATGVALVKERGRLMSTAPRGAMAAVVGLTQARVAELIAGSAFNGIDIANVNCAQQIVISGLYDDIVACETLFTQAGARYVKLNVSAAFHSRYMRDIEQQFKQFAQSFTFNPLNARVISNYTALDYPQTDYLSLLTRQISHPVRWYESISRLLAQGEVSQQEIGPGQVLTSLFAKIKAQPMTLSAEPKGLNAASAAKPRVVFMYGGQGAQYYGMGAELYRRNAAFRSQMDQCDALYRQHTGHSLLEPLYDETRRHLPLTDVVLSNAALLSVGVSLTRVLGAEGVEPGAVVGYSLGECISAVVAGVLTLDDAMKLLVNQARLLSEKTAGGGMMSVLAPVDHFHAHSALYQHTELASINFQKNFVVSGEAPASCCTEGTADPTTDYLDAAAGRAAFPLRRDSRHRTRFPRAGGDVSHTDIVPAGVLRHVRNVGGAVGRRVFLASPAGQGRFLQFDEGFEREQRRIFCRSQPERHLVNLPQIRFSNAYSARYGYQSIRQERRKRI
ncbi:ACP S-malonyltransferase [Rouxiella badensis]|nr:ACP S-malonyltransferase [Rouxiella badensis]